MLTKSCCIGKFDHFLPIASMVTTLAEYVAAHDEITATQRRPRTCNRDANKLLDGIIDP